MQESLGEDASNAFVSGIVAALKENMIQTMITETEKYVETGNFEKPAQGDGKNQASIQEVSQKLNTPDLEYSGVKSTQIDGNIAIVTLTLHDKKVDKDFDLKIKMRAIDGGEWQVVEVANLIEFMQEQEKAVQEKLAEINAPVKRKWTQPSTYPIESPAVSSVRTPSSRPIISASRSVIPCRRRIKR